MAENPLQRHLDAMEKGMADAYLIVKRGLYYRPESCGYTGLKREAGRYSLDEVAVHFPNTDSPNQDGMTYIAEAEAPEFSPGCAWDVRLIERTRKEARAEAIRQAAAKAFALGAPKAVEEGILALIEGDKP